MRKNNANFTEPINIVLVIVIVMLLSLIFIKNNHKMLHNDGFDNQSEISNNKNLLKGNIPNVYYINLEVRTDRKQNLLSEFKKINYPTENIIRVNAVKHKIGTLGCLQSHIICLENGLKETNNCEYIVVCEDDFCFKNNKTDTIYYLNSIFSNEFKDWNVILLAINGSSKNKMVHRHFYEVESGQTTSGYIIKKKYIPVLLKLWKDLYSRTKHTKTTPDHNDHIDQIWKKLQHDKWYVTKPVIGYQYASHSDIQGGYVDYGV